MEQRETSVLILHNQPRTEPGSAGVYLESDASVLDQAAAVGAALRELGIPYRVQGVARLEEIPAVLATTPDTVIFNLVEAFHERAEDAVLVPALCRAYGKGCTGNDTPALQLALDKWRSKGVLRQAALPVPEGVLVLPGQPVPKDRLPQGRIIIKPAANDAREGIEEEGVLDGADAARVEEYVLKLHERFRQPVLIEKYVGKRELNVSLIERNGAVEVMPIAEIDFSAFEAGKPRIVSYAAKWLEHSFEYQNTPRILPAPLTPNQAESVRVIALGAWKALDCHDYVRVDMRLNEAGRPVILEVNPNPDISPEGGYAAATAAGNVPYPEFVAAVVANAVARRAASGASPGRLIAAQPPRPSTDPAFRQIRYSVPADRDAVLKLLADTQFFRPDEVVVASEVLDEALAKGPADHYQSFVYDDGEGPLGWVCHGPIACTIGSFDVYWLAVSPACQGKGLGRLLMEFAEVRIREAGGRLVVVETSGRPDYDSTRAFYRRIGYAEAARLHEFYAANDDKVIYLKRV